jgi:RNA polymerase sigma factor (sigma-70 family)
MIEGQAEEIFKAFWPRLLRASQGFLGARAAEAQDMVHETYLVAFSKLDRYDPSAGTYAWLRQICLRLCYARLRSSDGALGCMETEIKQYRQAASIERVNSENLELQQQQQLELLREMIKSLPPDSRQVIQLRNVNGMTYAQICQTLELSQAALVARLQRARALIRESLSNFSVDPAPAPDPQTVAA